MKLWGLRFGVLGTRCYKEKILGRAGGSGLFLTQYFVFIVFIAYKDIFF